MTEAEAGASRNVDPAQFHPETTAGRAAETLSSEEGCTSESAPGSEDADDLFEIDDERGDGEHLFDPDHAPENARGASEEPALGTIGPVASDAGENGPAGWNEARWREYREAHLHNDRLRDAVREAARLRRQSDFRRYSELLLRSHQCKLVAAWRSQWIEAQKRDDIDLSADYIWQLAGEIDPFEPSAEKVVFWVEPKASGGFRDRFAFGPVGRADQTLCNFVLPEVIRKQDHQFGSTDAALETVRAHLSSGSTWAVLNDVQDCYLSLDPAVHVPRIPLPRSVIDHTVRKPLSGNLVRNPSQTGWGSSQRRGHTGVPEGGERGRPGLPEGSKLSQPIAEHLLGLMHQGLSSRAGMVAYLDDAVMLRSSRADAERMQGELCSVASDAGPVGRLRFKRLEAVSAADGFEFLGHRIRCASGRVHMMPSDRNFVNFNTIMNFMRICRATEAEIEQYVNGWHSGFRFWDGSYPEPRSTIFERSAERYPNTRGADEGVVYASLAGWVRYLTRGQWTSWARKLRDPMPFYFRDGSFGLLTVAMARRLKKKPWFRRYRQERRAAFGRGPEGHRPDCTRLGWSAPTD